jgi:hypothetical protein
MLISVRELGRRQVAARAMFRVVASSRNRGQLTFW